MIHKTVHKVWTWYVRPILRPYRGLYERHLIDELGAYIGRHRDSSRLGVPHGPVGSPS